MITLFWAGTITPMSYFSQLLIRFARWWDGSPSPRTCWSFEEYHNTVSPLANYENAGHNLLYPAIGLPGEVGELCEKVKKLWRDCGVTDGSKIIVGSEADRLRAGALKEAGDVLWYLDAIVVHELKSSLTEVARLNVEKLYDRVKRDKLGGSGDER